METILEFPIKVMASGCPFGIHSSCIVHAYNHKRATLASGKFTINGSYESVIFKDAAFQVNCDKLLNLTSIVDNNSY